MSTQDEDGLLEVEAVRRRQLVNAALHGSARSWTVVRRRLPAAIAGLVAAAVIMLGVGVTTVVRAELDHNRTVNPPVTGTR